MKTHSVIGIRAEDKSKYEARVPLVPEDIRELQARGVAVAVQSSAQRAFGDEEFSQTGITVTADLENCPIILGLKEIPVDKLEPGKVYFFFSHVIKGQAYNMPMLKRILDLGITLVDYERIVDEHSRRLIFFGRHAGIAGMINSLWALGQRLRVELGPNPLDGLRQARHYRDLEQARQAVGDVADRIAADGLPAAACPTVVGFAGYGNVSEGAQEIFDLLPFREIRPHQLPDLMADIDRPANLFYKVVFTEADLFEPREPGRPFDLQEYYRCGSEKYVSIFDRHVGHLILLINGNYWDERYPRILTLETCRRLWSGGNVPRLKVIGDISCDVKGAIECTVKATYPDNPVYVYHPDTGQVSDGFAGRGPVVMAVEILPTEIPRESSTYFSGVLKNYIPDIAAADWGTAFENLKLPPEIKRAVIVLRGALTPDYRYLQAYLKK
jgi:alpha-aminoadipic semialdehyde synthase